VVVIVFAVAEFTQGAWGVVVVMPLLVYALVRTNRQYRAEDTVLEEGAAVQACEARILLPWPISSVRCSRVRAISATATATVRSARRGLAALLGRLHESRHEFLRKLRHFPPAVIDGE
jgi:hypothetical protein